MGAVFGDQPGTWQGIQQFGRKRTGRIVCVTGVIFDTGKMVLRRRQIDGQNTRIESEILADVRKPQCAAALACSHLDDRSGLQAFYQTHVKSDVEWVFRKPQATVSLLLGAGLDVIQRCSWKCYLESAALNWPGLSSVVMIVAWHAQRLVGFGIMICTRRRRSSRFYVTLGGVRFGFGRIPLPPGHIVGARRSRP